MSTFHNFLVVFGVRQREYPSPLQIAAETLLYTQRSLVEALLTREDSAAEVDKLEKREARLRADLLRLSQVQKAQSDSLE